MAQGVGEGDLQVGASVDGVLRSRPRATPWLFRAADRADSRVGRTCHHVVLQSVDDLGGGLSQVSGRADAAPSGAPLP